MSEATARPSAAPARPMSGAPPVLGFPEPGPPLFASVVEVRERLAEVGYLADDGIAGVVHLADRLAKPVLVEGPAGTGKTELAKSVARVTGSRLIRLQCYEGLDESKALYEWNYKKQLLRIQAEQVAGPGGATAWSELESDQPAAGDPRHGLGELGLARAGGPLHQHRLGQTVG